LIQGAHVLIAMRRNEPHWLLTDQDAKTYGTALANVARHFEISATQKMLDFSALFICACNMETPRVYASVQARRARRERDQKPPPPSAQVFQFRQPGPPPPAAPSTPGPEQAQPDGVGVEGFTGDGIDAPPIGGHH
jgi:hypothetical protein